LHAGSDVMLCCVLFWLPGKMGEPVFVTKVLNGEITQAGVALIQLYQGGEVALYTLILVSHA
jgi:hypothetical protein